MRHPKPYIAFIFTGLVTLVVVFLLAAQHFHSGATRALEALPQDEDPVAVVKSILVNGSERTDVPQSDMSVTRLTAEVRGGQTGMLLVPGDEIGTGANAKVTLLFLDAAPEKDNEVLIDSNARMRVGSILNLLGRVLVRSKGQFEAATQSVKLDEAGAEYELVVQPDGTNRIRVLDGALRITAPGAAPTLRRVRPGPLGSSVNQGSTLAQELQQVILGPDGMLRKDRATQAELEETLNWSNEVIVAAQPTYSAQSIIPHMQSWQERAQQFRVARRGAILNNDPDSYEALGRIYVDWGNGAKAVGELRKAVAAFQTPERLTSLGEAYRLTGNWRNAHIVLARTVRQYPDFAPAMNALGNVYFDQAKAAQDRKDYRTARADLENARQHYERAKTNSTAFIISESNIAETELALGDIAREQGRFDVAINQYKQAERTFNQVERTAGTYPFADKGLGDVYRGISAIARIQQDKAFAQTYFTRSQEKYREALQSHGDVSEAYVGLGKLYEDNGDKEKAIVEYRQAIRVRPEMPLAYYHYAVAIADRDPATAAAYAKAYLKLEREVFKQGEKARNARALVDPRPPPTPRPTSTTTVTPPPSPEPGPSSSVKVPGVNGDKPEEALRKLRDRGLQGQLRDQPECKPSGKVVGTDPRKDTRVQPGTMVTVFISSLGENAVTVPSVTNQSLSEAQRELRRLGLVVNAESRQETNAVPENTVVRQEPKAYSRLNPGCTVELTTSIRVRLIEVPSYIGLSRQQAFQRLSSGQLIRGRVTEVDSQAPPGTVIDQRPNPGAMVQPGTRVDLLISRSKGVDYATVPDLRGRNLDQAKAMLRNSRLTLGQVSYKTAGPNQRVNTIVSQSPPSFAKVVPGTTVNVVIAIYQIN